MQPRQRYESQNRKRTMRILHLEDCLADQELVAALLIEAEIACEIVTVQARMAFINMLQNGRWDLILASYALPGFDGFSALTIARLLCPNTPFIFVTGAMSEDFPIETLRRGATDYVLKGKMGCFVRAVRRALNESAEKARRKIAEEQLRVLAHYDALTGLANRTLLRDRLSQALASAARSKEKVALLSLDLDHFKTINDSLGHSVGDLLLKQVAARLKRAARAQDTVSRIGGDEFIIVLTAVKDVGELISAADRFARAVTAEFVVQGHSLFITCSIGISISPDHGTDGESLSRYADAALFRAKDNGRNNFQLFTQNMNARTMERLTLESSLRVALDRKQLLLEYQPQLDLATGKIVGAEALLRWRHPQLGLVSPAEFIPIAESSGMIVPIGEWVLRTACTQAQRWQEEGLAVPTISVNVSAVQFRQKQFLALVKNALNETGLAPEALELELTESLLLSSASFMLTVLRRLKDAGLKLPFHDFGSGYSCLSYLRHIPVHKLKIDPSFVQAVTTNSDNAAIVDAIIKMAKILNLRVLAEGVETEPQMSFLRAQQCDEIQGYYLSKPLAAGDFADKVRSSSSSERPLEAENSPSLKKDASAHPLPTVSQDWTRTAGAAG